MTLVSSRGTAPWNSKGKIGSGGAEYERGMKNVLSATASIVFRFTRRRCYRALTLALAGPSCLYKFSSSEQKHQHFYTIAGIFVTTSQISQEKTICCKLEFQQSQKSTFLEIPAGDRWPQHFQKLNYGNFPKCVCELHKRVGGIAQKFAVWYVWVLFVFIKNWFVVLGFIP